MTVHSSPDPLCNLWQGQKSESFAMSTGELRQAALKLEKRVFWRNLREYAAAAIVVVAFGNYFYKFHTPLLRLGSGLTIAGVLLVAFNLHRKGAAKSIAPEEDAQSCVDFHRSELVRQRDLLASVWKWYLLPFIPGLTIFLLGLLQSALAQPAARAHLGFIVAWFAALAAICTGTFVLVARLNHGAAKKLQKEIDALDALRMPSGQMLRLGVCRT